MPYFSIKIFCDPSLEPSYEDGSDEGSQHIFSLRNRKIIFELSSIPLLSGALPNRCNFNRDMCLLI